MKYPMFKVHVDKESAIKNLEKVLDSGFFNEGVEVSNFKKALEEKMRFKNLVMTNSCTSALTMAIKLSNVQPEDEVISTSMTCVASNTPILNLNCKVVWADIDPKTGNISPDSVREKVTEKTKAVVCVNWAGLPCDLEELDKICKENKIKLIQDAAHAFGATYKGLDISEWADFTCYSFQAIKHITTGDGGCIISRSDKDFEKAKKLKWFGLDRENTKDKKGEWKGQRWKDDVFTAGYKFNMNNIAGAIGMSQIGHIDKILEAHRLNAKKYSELFKKVIKIKPLLYPKESNPSHWVYTVLLDGSLNRDNILKSLNDMGIGAGLVHVPNHNYTCFNESIENLPGVDYFHKHQLSLPCGWWLSSEDVEYVAKSLIESCEEYG